jgi:SpoIIAA-like
MLNAITDVPPSVIGFEAAGKLTAEDYRDVLLPAIQNAAASGEVRIVIVMPAFDGFTPGALWQDLKMGVENWRAWERIALVTDVDWMRHGTEWFGWMTPGEVQHFPLDQRAEAIAWAAGD